jgi:hypothetical protein
MLLLGIGLGLVMQVLIVAVQNDVDYGDLGVATSGATLFRLVGGSLGTAVLGAIFASRLASRLAALLPASVGATGSITQGISVETLARLPQATRVAYSAAFTGALNTVFLFAAMVCAFGFLLSWLLPERPLRATIAAVAGDPGQEAAEAFARPAGPGAIARQLDNALWKLADRDVQREHIERIVERAGVALSPLAAWLLVRIERAPQEDLVALGASRRISAERVESALEELYNAKLIERESTSLESVSEHELTDTGCAVLGKLMQARRDHLNELAADWNPDTDPDAGAYLREAVHEMVPDVKRPARLSIAK